MNFFNNVTQGCPILLLEDQCPFSAAKHLSSYPKECPQSTVELSKPIFVGNTSKKENVVRYETTLPEKGWFRCI